MWVNLPYFTNSVYSMMDISQVEGYLFQTGENMKENINTAVTTKSSFAEQKSEMIDEKLVSSNVVENHQTSSHHQLLPSFYEKRQVEDQFFNCEICLEECSFDNLFQKQHACSAQQCLKVSWCSVSLVDSFEIRWQKMIISWYHHRCQTCQVSLIVICFFGILLTTYTRWWWWWQ